MNRIEQAMQGNHDNYILPFFWQHGESEAVLREYMAAIAACGIGAVCVESRPHPDFAGDKWWSDMEIILDEAKKRSMKVWFLDDSHFPTGYANGALTNMDSSLQKQFIMVTSLELCGPQPQVDIPVADMGHCTLPPQNQQMRVFSDDEIISVTASRVEEKGRISLERIDLTPLIFDGWITWDVPDGLWHINVVFKTRNGGGRHGYINMLDEASCKVLIDAVYEPHYMKFKADFGSTIAGFFSDEPQFGNTNGYNMDERMGKMMPLPWSSAMDTELEERLGAGWRQELRILWYESSDKQHNSKLRFAYMDSATKLWEKCFSKQIGQWCEQHGVEYIGHIIEDYNQHARLGCGPGHFFRGMAGQHMAGVDIIGNQVLPGGQYSMRIGGANILADGEFNHFALCKLGTSLAHIDPKKQGRCMCEIFGASGWDSDTHYMKFLLDHCLVRGVNHFVPHAFSPKEFPDPDCPPHFYAHGKNPQYRHFSQLMRYLNRMCHILNGGKHISSAAILYHGEAEWCSRNLMFMQKPARALMEAQIDFDILPSDVFENSSDLSCDKLLSVNGESYGALIIPATDYIPSKVASFISVAAKQEFPVIFLERLPLGTCEGTALPDLCSCTVCTLDELIDTLSKHNAYEVSIEPSFKDLRTFHYRNESNIFMLFNESLGSVFDGEIKIPTEGPWCAYDAVDNKLLPLEYASKTNESVIKIQLQPLQSIVLIQGQSVSASNVVQYRSVAIDSGWKMSKCPAENYPNFSAPEEIHKFISVGRSDKTFSGYIAYENTFELDTLPVKARLTITDAFSGAQLWVNGKMAGERFCPPYVFDIGDYLLKGENSLRIELASTLARQQYNPDDISIKFQGFRAIQPSGILGSVSLDLC